MHPSIEAVKTSVAEVKSQLNRLNAGILSKDEVHDVEFKVHRSTAALRDLSKGILVADLAEFICAEEQDTDKVADRALFIGNTLEIVNELSNWQSHRIHVNCGDRYRYVNTVGDAIVSRLRHLFEECSCGRSDSACVGTQLFVKR